MGGYCETSCLKFYCCELFCSQIGICLTKCRAPFNFPDQNQMSCLWQGIKGYCWTSCHLGKECGVLSGGLRSVVALWSWSATIRWHLNIWEHEPNFRVPLSTGSTLISCWSLSLFVLMSSYHIFEFQGIASTGCAWLSDSEIWGWQFWIKKRMAG